jgi:hypothetical protein
MAKFGAHRPMQRFETGAVTHVAFLGQRSSPERANALGGRPNQLRSTAGGDDIGTRCGEAGGQGQPDARSSTNHNRCFRSKVERRMSHGKGSEVAGFELPDATSNPERRPSRRANPTTSLAGARFGVDLTNPHLLLGEPWYCAGLPPHVVIFIGANCAGRSSAVKPAGFGRGLLQERTATLDGMNELCTR